MKKLKELFLRPAFTQSFVYVVCVGSILVNGFMVVTSASTSARILNLVVIIVNVALFSWLVTNQQMRKGFPAYEFWHMIASDVQRKLDQYSPEKGQREIQIAVSLVVPDHDERVSTTTIQ